MFGRNQKNRNGQRCQRNGRRMRLRDGSCQNQTTEPETFQRGCGRGMGQGRGLNR